MATREEFLKSISEGYRFEGESIRLGRAVFDGEVVEGAEVYLPLKTMNRHGLIAGATGTGKTKSRQMISQALSEASVPVLGLDVEVHRFPPGWLAADARESTSWSPASMP